MAREVDLPKDNSIVVGEEDLVACVIVVPEEQEVTTEVNVPPEVRLSDLMILRSEIDCVSEGLLNGFVDWREKEGER